MRIHDLTNNKLTKQREAFKKIPQSCAYADELLYTVVFIDWLDCKVVRSFEIRNIPILWQSIFESWKTKLQLFSAIHSGELDGDVFDFQLRRGSWIHKLDCHVTTLILREMFNPLTTAVRLHVYLVFVSTDQYRD